LLLAAIFAAAARTANIVWVSAEDASPHIGSYVGTLIPTPHLDRMAAEGVWFANAFVTNPVRPPSRSAMVSGVYQTTLGVHKHRSQQFLYDEGTRIPLLVRFPGNEREGTVRRDLVSRFAWAEELRYEQCCSPARAAILKTGLCKDYAATLSEGDDSGAVRNCPG
jgi:arylsulfatase A-like enzyme